MCVSSSAGVNPLLGPTFTADLHIYVIPYLHDSIAGVGVYIRLPAVSAVIVRNEGKTG